MNIHTVYESFQRYFRPKRVRKMRENLAILDDPQARILDVGGVAGWWKEVRPASADITIVNLDSALREASEEAGYQFFVGDARSLPFANGDFDLVHSNSVIEHVGNLDDQWRFAREVHRCGKAIYIQTPNKWFPVEPHLIALFIHWLPFKIQRHLVRRFSVWGWLTKPSQLEIDKFLHGTRLLTGREVDAMFPGCVRCDEKFMGFTKSFVVVQVKGD